MPMMATIAASSLGRGTRQDSRLTRTWSRLSAPAQKLPCTAPFSFFFDVVEAYWRAPKPSNSLPLHRICTLARKQGVDLLVLEDAAGREDVALELDALDAASGGGGEAQAIALSFLRDAASSDLSALPASSLIGQVVLINYRERGSETFTTTYIFEAILRPPLLPGSDHLLNNYLSPPGAFRCVVDGVTFNVRGFYFCQQNEKTNACAHACLRMLLNQLAPRQGVITNEQINAQINRPDAASGLQVPDLVAVVEQLGFEAEKIPCVGMDSQKYLQQVASVVESGDRALLIIPTKKAPECHVVAVIGHTRNTDEWHPEAIPAYGHPTAEFFASAMWIDHLVIHDDNLGPYYTLASRTLESESCLRADTIIAIRDKRPDVPPDYAQNFAAIVLRGKLPKLDGVGSGKWMDHLTRNEHRFVLRPVLMKRAAYLEHLASAEGHDHTKLSTADLERFAALPDQFWMVEFSLPALYTGNRSKLGEVLISSQGKVGDFLTGFHAMRLPSLIVLREGDLLETYDSGLVSHSPIFRAAPHDNEW